MARSVSRKGAKRFRYSIENTGIHVAVNQEAGGIYQNGQVVVPATNVQGTRTIKHLTVSLSEDTDSQKVAFYWALVFVPEGYSPNSLFPNGQDGSVYEPNQFVLNCGYIDPEAGPVRISSRIAKNLQSGDSIQLILGCRYSSADVRGIVSYAVAYK